MTNERIASVLKDLYTIDPSLREHEAELIPLLRTLLERNPSASPDASFVQELRRRLQSRADVLMDAPPSPLFSSLLAMNRFTFAVTGAILGIAVAVPTVYFGMRGLPSAPGDTDPSATPLFSYSVTDAGDEAFNLSNVTIGGAIRGQGGGGGGAMGGGMPAVAASTEGDTAARQATNAPEAGGDAKMIAPVPEPGLLPYEYTEFNYVFKGELPALTQQKVPVYQREKSGASMLLSELASRFKIGVLDLGTFGDAKVDMINFYQDRQFGYALNINTREGTLSISPQWDKWPRPDANCTTEACFQQHRVKLGDIPADDVLIRIAKEFADEHGFDLSHYGEPEVDNLWRRDYERQQDKRYAYVPEVQRVVFPLKIDDQIVYEEGGMKHGLSVGVNVREKKVSEVWNLSSQNYLKSDYPAVTDAAQVTRFLQQLDKMPGEYMPPNAKKKTVEVELGTPTVSLVKFYAYDRNQTRELVAPALVFPIAKAPQTGDTFFYRQNVVVPIATEIYERMTNRGDRPLMME